MPLTVAYDSPFVPPEWIAAHGMSPCGLTAEPGAAMPTALPTPEGGCPYAQALFQTVAAQRPVGIVLTTACDQLRRGSERPVLTESSSPFLMNIPATWQTPSAVRLYQDELKRMGRYLVGLGGRTPSPSTLAETMERFDTGRAALRALGGVLPPRRFSEALHRFRRDGTLPSSEEEEAPSDSGGGGTGTAIGLIGGPLLASGLRLFDWVAARGGTIVLDGTENGERTLPAPFDRRTLREDPFGTLCRAYFSAIPAIWQRPNTRFYRWLKAEISERQLQGLILYRHLWCDLWHGEAARIRDWAPVPVVEIDVDDADDTFLAERHRTRIEAFVEMLA